MDFISSHMKGHLKLSVQSAASLSLPILGEPHRLKVLWKSGNNMMSYIEKIVITKGDVYYQTKTEPGVIRNMDGLGGVMSATKFYAPSYFNSVIVSSITKPKFLTLDEIVIKTEKPYKDYMVAEHFTKKIYFIASDSLASGGSLYAADIGKGATEVVAEKVDNVGNGSKLTALVVDQITGDIILAGYTDNPSTGRQYFIESLQKTWYLSEMLKFAGVSTSKENVDNKQELDKHIP